MKFDSQRAKNAYSSHPAAANSSSLSISRIVGYSLLVMTVINWVDILLPLQLMNSTWEMQTAGAFVESVPIPFLALVLVLNGGDLRRKKFERFFIHLLSYSCLLLAIFYLLLVLVIANATIRVNRQIDIQAGDVLKQQVNQISQLEEQLNQANNQEIIDILQEQGVILDDNQSEEPKQRLLDYLPEIRQSIQEQNQKNKAARKQSTLKSVIKWIVGAVVSSFTFIYLWILTRWARLPQSLSKGRQ